MISSAMTFSKFCASLGCPLRNIRWSWAALSSDGSRAVFTVWDDELDAGRYALWSPSDRRNERLGAREIQRIASTVAGGGVEALGVRCFAKDVKASPRTRRDFDQKTLLGLRIVQEGGALIGYVAAHVPVDQARRGTAGPIFALNSVNALSDLDQPPLGAERPDRVSGLTTSFARDQKVREFVLKRSGGRCEYCGSPGFEMRGGRRYVETHHVIALANDGADTVRNVIALCAQHHREAHYGLRAEELERAMVETLARLNATMFA